MGFQLLHCVGTLTSFSGFSSRKCREIILHFDRGDIPWSKLCVAPTAQTSTSVFADLAVINLSL